jgi:hypothetical protein
MCFLAAILNSIFVSGRCVRTPSLGDNCSKQAGFQFANFILSGFFSLIFGLIAGFILKNINSLS